MILAGVAALALVACDIVARATRVHVLLGDAWSCGLGSAIAVNAYGDAASAVTPARLGGEPVRFIALRRRNAATPAAVAVLATERILDMGLAAAVTVAGVAWLGSRGFGDVRVLLARFTSPHLRPWLVAVTLVLAVFAGIALRFRRRLPQRARQSLRDALAHVRAMAGARFAGAMLLTAVSMSARVLVLPALLWGAGARADLLPAILGSFVLLYAQLVLPTPAGAGAVELGFVAGFAPHMGTSRLTALLVLWRVFTLAVPTALGVALLVRTSVQVRARGGQRVAPP